MTFVIKHLKGCWWRFEDLKLIHEFNCVVCCRISKNISAGRERERERGWGYTLMNGRPWRTKTSASENRSSIIRCYGNSDMGSDADAGEWSGGEDVESCSRCSAWVGGKRFLLEFERKEKHFTRVYYFYLVLFIK